MKFIVTICVVVCLLAASTDSAKVAFRLDDIQDFWISDCQMYVINAFKARNIPLTIGVITHEFGQDSTMVNFMKSLVGSSWKNEIACHGDQHIDFTLESLSSQNSLLSLCRSRINQYIGNGVQLTTFIPPYNEWNANTISAALSNGYSYISARQGNVPQSNMDWSRGPIYHVPIFAQTTDDNGVLESMTQVWNDINTQISGYGFAAVMLHPQDYATNNVCDNSKFSYLTSLLDTAQASGHQFVLLREIPTTSPTTTTTKAPTTTTTTKAPTTTTTTTKAPTSGPTTTTTTKAPTSGPTSGPSGSVCATNYDCIYGTCTNGACACLDRWCKDASGLCTVPMDYNWNTASWYCTGSTAGPTSSPTTSTKSPTSSPTSSPTTTTTKAPTSSPTSSPTTTTTKAPSGGSSCTISYDCVYGTCNGGTCGCDTRWCLDSSGHCTVPMDYNWTTLQWYCA